MGKIDILSILGEIALGIGRFITNTASSTMKSVSHDRRFSDEDREKCRNASDSFSEYADQMKAKSNELRENRHNNRRNKEK